MAWSHIQLWHISFARSGKVQSALYQLSGLLTLSARFLPTVMNLLRKLAEEGQGRHRATQPPPPLSSHSFRSQSQKQDPFSKSTPASSSSSTGSSPHSGVEHASLLTEDGETEIEASSS